MNITIEQLRKNGYKVRVIHSKLDETDQFYHLADRCTIIQIRDKEGNEFSGMARCSKSDHYNRKMGNRIALGRALSQMNSFHKSLPTFEK
jgi:hypothetical protein